MPTPHDKGWLPPEHAHAEGGSGGDVAPKISPAAATAGDLFAAGLLIHRILTAGAAAHPFDTWPDLAPPPPVVGDEDGDADGMGRRAAWRQRQMAEWRRCWDASGAEEGGDGLRSAGSFRMTTSTNSSKAVYAGGQQKLARAFAEALAEAPPLLDWNVKFAS